MLSPQGETETRPWLRDAPGCLPGADHVSQRLKNKACPPRASTTPSSACTLPPSSPTPRSPNARVSPARTALSEPTTVHPARGQLLARGKSRP